MVIIIIIIYYLLFVACLIFVEAYPGAVFYTLLEYVNEYFIKRWIPRSQVHLCRAVRSPSSIDHALFTDANHWPPRRIR